MQTGDEQEKSKAESACLKNRCMRHPSPKRKSEPTFSKTKPEKAGHSESAWRVKDNPPTGGCDNLEA
jgi:hypothetical protein